MASLVREANREARKKREGKGNKYDYRVNVNHAIGIYKNYLIPVVIEEDPIARRYLMKEMLHLMERRVVPIRPGRETARKAENRAGRFHHNHKSNC